MIFLKKYVKFRKEENYILLCDCSSIQNYELPKECYDFLVDLRNGIELDDVSECFKNLLDDLKELQLISNKPNCNEGFYNENWINLGYNENEFF